MTGCLWEGGPDELIEAVRSFDTGAVDSEACIANARRFDSKVFRDSFPRAVHAALHQGPSDRGESWPRIARRPSPMRRPAWRANRFSGA